VIISRLSEEEGVRRARIKRVPFTRGSGKIYTFSLSLCPFSFSLSLSLSLSIYLSFSLSSPDVRNYVASLKSMFSRARARAQIIIGRAIDAISEILRAMVSRARHRYNRDRLRYLDDPLASRRQVFVQAEDSGVSQKDPAVIVIVIVRRFCTNRTCKYRHRFTDTNTVTQASTLLTFATLRPSST